MAGIIFDYIHGTLALAYLALDRPHKALDSFHALLETEAVPPEQMEDVKRHVSELEKRLEAGKTGYR